MGSEHSDVPVVRRRRALRLIRARTLVLALVSVVAIGAFGAGALAASRNAKITATWDCCGAGGAAIQFWKVSESSSGALSGSGLTTARTVFASISGRVSGRHVTLVTTYNSFSPGYVATFVGKVAGGGRRMSGTWKSNRGQAGTWTATRARKARKKKA
jgi:hypothetical protein